MKRFIIFLFILIIPFFSSSSQTYAAQEKEYFAKITSNGVFLCETPNANSAIFEIPYSYFVKVEYVVDDYFKVSYDNVQGYVKKDKVALMNGTPLNPYAKASFKIFVEYKLYQSPYQNSLEVYDLTTNDALKFYGTMTGQPLTSKSNLWYYCSTVVDGTTFYGYVFSGITDNLTTIPTNGETFQTISESELNSQTSEFSSLSTGTKVILIVSISIPSLLIMYFLIKPSRIVQMSKKKTSEKQKNKRLRNKDYFEFDENDI